jgi:Glycoside hydrolase family 44
VKRETQLPSFRSSGPASSEPPSTKSLSAKSVSTKSGSAKSISSHMPSWRKALYGAQIIGLSAVLVSVGIGGGGAKTPIALQTASTDAVIVGDDGRISTDATFGTPLGTDAVTFPTADSIGAITAPASVVSSGDGVTPAVPAKSVPLKPIAKPDDISTLSKQPALVLYKGGLLNGWTDMGYAKKRKTSGGPAVIDMTAYEGLLIGNPGQPFNAKAIEVTYKVDRGLGEFLAVSLGSTTVPETNEVPLPSTTFNADTWTTGIVLISDMNVNNIPVDRIRIRPSQDLPEPTNVTIKLIRLLGVGKSPVPAGPVATAPAVLAGDPNGQKGSVTIASPPVDVANTVLPNDPNVGDPTRDAKSSPTAKTKGKKGRGTMSVDCQTPRKISPWIYGVGWNGAAFLKDNPWGLGATVNRWGGNVTTRYNWQLGNVWNTGNDYFFRNTDATTSANAAEAFLAANAANGLDSVVSIPMIGWVAKDNVSASFPTSVFGKQQYADPSGVDAGNGLTPDGKKLTPQDPSLTSIAAPPEFLAPWVQKLAGRSKMYILDNEPDLWNSTHRDVHPKGITYDELLDKTIRYGTMIRANDPTALISGPAFGNWVSVFSSGADVDANNFGADAPDRKAHGKEPFLAWWIKSMRAYETKTNTKLVDVMDIHYYPQGNNVYGNGIGGTDPATAALRIRSVRSLWDPTYTDESWIANTDQTNVQLIPRMQKLIAENAPGMKLSIGEWSFGGEGHMSGGLATAEALGVFGATDVHSAFYWTAPPANSPSFWAFRAFRNYDGSGAKFLDNSVKASRTKDLSMFASTNDAGTEMTVVMLNSNPQNVVPAQVDLLNCRSLAAIQTFTYNGKANGFAVSREQKGSGSAFALNVAPYSINVVHLKLK